MVTIILIVLKIAMMCQLPSVSRYSIVVITDPASGTVDILILPPRLLCLPIRHSSDFLGSGDHRRAQLHMKLFEHTVMRLTGLGPSRSHIDVQHYLGGCYLFELASSFVVSVAIGLPMRH